jgi:glycerophosphodiester phosphodiesterase
LVRAGHRGLGRSYRDDVLDQAEIRENTLLSFSEAGKAGAEYVELDVMLTKDRVPVIFHDFVVGIHGANHTQNKQAMAIHIKDLTLHQLKTLYTTGTDSREYLSGNTGASGQRRMSSTASMNRLGLKKPSFADLRQVMDNNPRKTASVSTEVKKSHHTLDVPTLKELLTELPLWLGLNIEIKYPVTAELEWLRNAPEMDINAYLDDILQVLFEHVGRRRIVLSCFHPDICSALHMKQARFPVCLLSGDDPAVMTDHR